jgi:hypothetical protein
MVGLTVAAVEVEYSACNVQYNVFTITSNKKIQIHFVTICSQVQHANPWSKLHFLLDYKRTLRKYNK